MLVVSMTHIWLNEKPYQDMNKCDENKITLNMQACGYFFKDFHVSYRNIKIKSSDIDMFVVKIIVHDTNLNRKRVCQMASPK